MGQNLGVGFNENLAELKVGGVWAVVGTTAEKWTNRLGTDLEWKVLQAFMAFMWTFWVSPAWRPIFPRAL